VGHVPYNSTFDGNDFTITLVNEDLKQNQRLSLFEIVSDDAIVRNLNVAVRAKAAATTVNLIQIAPIARQNYGTIKNVTTDCAILGTQLLSGVVTHNRGRIEGVTVSGWIEGVPVNQNGTAGNIAGIANNSYAGSVISRCVNNAAITGTGSNIAGLVSQLNGRLEYSANHGDVKNSTTKLVTGGLVGLINSNSLGTIDK
jgi:hypothetical protein